MAGHFSSLLSAERPSGDRVPVTVLTGFLGSGKTTLLNGLLRLPDLSGTAVIVNEFGAVGIDHDLVAQTHDDTVLLPNGCLCCAVRGDLVEALCRLAERPDAPRQVLIETSGLADPGPILRTLMGEAAVRGRYRLAGVACAVDAVLAMDTLDRHPESAQQVAVADALYMTKTDLVKPAPELLQRLESLNALAPLHAGGPLPQALLAQLRHARRANDAGADAPYLRPAGTGDRGATASHRDGISSYVLVRDEPLPREAFANWLDMVIAMRGADLLRVKGIVNLAEVPDRPLVFHGVQHLFHPPETLPAWPGADRRTRIVFITRGVDVQALELTLDVLVRRHARKPQETP
ncbi:MAG TPA: GTP-binding protein [Ramlibacter sp.]|nr:GTP-binding protein [Ramlibacter sp.]